MRKYGLFGCLLGLLLLLAACGADKKVVKPETTATSQTSSSTVAQNEADLSPEEVAAKEGNHDEQVVVQITDEGYVTSHGDHYHFYNGKVGFEALISRDMVLTDPNYVLDQSHIVSDVADGHIIKVGENYYLYVTVANPQQLR